jgi:hypothetical protein
MEDEYDYSQYYEREEDIEDTRFMDDSPLWNDGLNIPPGVNEDEL